MKSMNIFIFFIQACLVQNVFSQCNSCAPGLPSPLAYDGLIGWGGIPAAAPCGLVTSSVAPFGYPAAGFIESFPYGGIGEGNVAVAGELLVAGNTAVVGQVPIMGAVSFCGAVPAAGAVSISGRCACGCDGWL